MFADCDQGAPDFACDGDARMNESPDGLPGRCDDGPSTAWASARMSVRLDLAGDERIDDAIEYGFDGGIGAQRPPGRALGGLAGGPGGVVKAAAHSARVAKSVDAADSKSVEVAPRVGSSPTSGTRCFSGCSRRGRLG